MTERTKTMFRFDPGLHERLTAAANERGITNLNWFVNKLLDEALDDLLPPSEFRLRRRGVASD